LNSSLPVPPLSIKENNEMKNFWKTILIMGIFAAASTHCAWAQYTADGNYSDRQLSPTTQPPYPTAAVGNDLLLAENVGGSIAANSSYPAINATSWKMAFFVGKPGVYGFDNNGSADRTTQSGFGFTGTGPTGVYPNAGAGKHTQDTTALLNSSGYITSGGNAWAYQYVATVTAFRVYDNLGRDTKYSLGVNTYTYTP